VDEFGLSQLSSQEMEEGVVQAKIYEGVIRQGELAGARVVLKAYPPRVLYPLADVMAMNELVVHRSLQTGGKDPTNVVKLLGGMVSMGGAASGEQWLVFRGGRDGTVTLEQYCKMAASARAQGQAVGEGEAWDRFDPQKPLRRRQAFMIKGLRGAFQGLDFMHGKDWLHQSMGPSSVVLSTTDERDTRMLNGRLKDLAFAVDVSNEALFGGANLADIWEKGGSYHVGVVDWIHARVCRFLSSSHHCSPSLLDAGKTEKDANPANQLADDLWARARVNGAMTAQEKRTFGISDDVYASGLMLLSSIFLAFCEEGSIDGPQLQRLVENTFRNDIQSFRDYADADDRWTDAVAFLDIGEGAGWELVGATLQSNWRSRPTVESILNHRFMTGEAFD